jgi:hypothetical protein
LNTNLKQLRYLCQIEDGIERVEDCGNEHIEKEIETTDNVAERPPEEDMEPACSIEALTEAVIEDSVLEYDLEPEMKADIEALIHDLELEEVEPESEVEVAE